MFRSWEEQPGSIVKRFGSFENGNGAGRQRHAMGALCLIRSAGTSHTFAAMSISPRLAPRTSPERAAVSTKNSKASFVDGPAREALIALRQAATSA